MGRRKPRRSSPRGAVDARGWLCYMAAGASRGLARESPGSRDRQKGRFMQYTQKPQAVRRGWKAWLGGALLPVLLGGCQNMSNTDAGILGGASA